MPPEAHIGYITFLGVYAVAVIAGIVSHVPGGVGVFEAVILLTLPGVPAEALLGSLLAYRAVYYLVPLVFGTLLFGSKELSAQRSRIAWAQELASIYIAPVVPQIAGALTFLAGTLLLFSGVTPAVDERLAFLDQFLPLPVLEVSHLVGSLVGLGLLVLARALFRRVQAAYHICVWLLIAGIFASLLKGLDFEEASLLALVLGVLVLGRRAFYRPTAILSERFTPVWVVSIAGRHRHGGVDRCHLLPTRELLGRAVVDLRPARQCATHAARLARCHRDRFGLRTPEHAAAGAAGAGGGERRGSGACPGPASQPPTPRWPMPH